MPWARVALAPIVGSPARVTCATCHGARTGAERLAHAGGRRVAAARVREAGWENYGGAMDAQMRNAIYGYLRRPATWSAPPTCARW